MEGLSEVNWLLFDLRRSLIVSTVNGPAPFSCYFNVQRKAVARAGEVMVMTTNTGFANGSRFKIVTRYQTCSFSFFIARFRAPREKPKRYWEHSERVGQ
jgi:hypothetical protein